VRCPLPLLPLLAASLLIAGCPIETEPGPEPEAPDITEVEFADFVTWARPIEDYIEAGVAEHGSEHAFTTGIHDLHVFADKLYLGYGDATVNMGRVFPIEVRRWADPADPDGVVAEFTTDEEQIDRYRSSGDLLTIPGIDATEDAWLGNVYVGDDDGSWFKSRTLDQGVHVHDTLVDGATVWACGSGATPEEWDDGAIHSLIHRSDDSGQSFEVAYRVPNEYPIGDARFTSLAMLDGALTAFGYRSDDSWQITRLIAYRVEDEELVPWDAMNDVLIDNIEPTGDGRALAAGVFAAGSLRFATRLVDGDGSEDLDDADDLTVLDLFGLDDGRILVLAIEGDEYPLPDGDYEVVVALWDPSDESWTTLKRQGSGTMPSSIAYWRGFLFVGLEDGRVRRARPLEE
jgi:hypothetical protein